MDDFDLQATLRALPSVDKLLGLPATADLVILYGRSLTITALRQTLDTIRAAMRNEQANRPPNALIIAQAQEWLVEQTAPTLIPVINGTGVIVHTNLGRAPLSEATLQALTAVAGNYNNLEYDLSAGQRGSRTLHAEQLLTRLTGAEAALVVNNNAAAVLLMLTALCRDREVIISRGQLVEIGGGFRVPDVMAQSGAKLVEVGTTNRTHLRDYRAAINENTAAILIAHSSNFKMIGFTSEPTLAEIAALAHEYHLPMLYDQGSGALLDTAVYGLAHEPTVQEGLAAPADLVTFSGDKLLGGPQAGILCGTADLIGQIKSHPLARAVRADKMALSALTATLTAYLTELAHKEIPIWQMISRSLNEISETADTWSATLQEQGIKAIVLDGESTVGGGSLPGATMPTKLVAIPHEAPDKLAERLRQHKIPVIGRIQDGYLVIDPRTILSKQVATLLQALIQYSVKS